MGHFGSRMETLGRIDKTQVLDFPGPFEVVEGMVIVVMDPVVEKL